MGLVESVSLSVFLYTSALLHRRRRQLWAVLLKKVWDVDALKCPEYGVCMKVIFFIDGG